MSDNITYRVSDGSIALRIYALFLVREALGALLHSEKPTRKLVSSRQEMNKLNQKGRKVLDAFESDKVKLLNSSSQVQKSVESVPGRCSGKIPESKFGCLPDTFADHR